MVDEVENLKAEDQAIVKHAQKSELKIKANEDKIAALKAQNA